jgi:CheY-like chemotaxis protein
MCSILVIEDDKGILELIETALTMQGHSVETAADGNEGIRKFDGGLFDVVITDCIMPHGDGHAVLHHIRRSARRHIPVIGMSGTPWLLKEADFDLVLAKPFTLQKMAESVRHIAAARPGDERRQPAAVAWPGPVATAFTG